MNVKNTVIGIVIFGAGAGVGYYVCKKKMVEQYKQDLIDIKQFYFDKIEEIGVMPIEFEPDDIIEDEEDDDDDETTNKEYNDRVSKYSSAIRNDHEGKGKPIIKYNKPPLIVEDWGDLEEDEEDPDEDDIDLMYEAELEARADEYARRKYENKSNGLPYVIDFNEFEDGPDDYERISLYYYTDDRVLCEDNDTKIETDDEELLIGFDYEDILDMQTTAWVRNDDITTLYEIHRIDGSYKLEVLGAVETPKEREYRILGRRKQGLDN